jgi:hypothetical protein
VAAAHVFGQTDPDQLSTQSERGVGLQSGQHFDNCQVDAAAAYR